MALDPGRVVSQLRELQELTGDEHGAQRVAWTETGNTARAWLDGLLEGLPLERARDAAGNDWWTLRGDSEQAVLIGGHIDSVPNGGWLDGCLNLVAGAEVLRRIAEAGTPPATVRLVNWADEEGARFGRSLFGTFGVERWRITCTGQATHVGSTSMASRLDSLAGAAKLALEIREIAARVGNGAVCTSGGVVCRPGIVTFVVETAEQAAFALLESTVPEYDRLGIVRGPQGTNLKGIAPSNIFKSKDDSWVVIAANADNVFRRFCDVIGRPELADDPLFATHLARGDNQDELEGIVADWAAQHDAAEIARVLNEAGVICGPIYTIADIFEDPQYKAREMLLEHVDPEFGPYIGPGVVPKLTRTPGAVHWSAKWEEGSHNQEVYGGLLGLGDDEIAELREEGVL